MNAITVWIIDDLGMGSPLVGGLVLIALTCFVLEIIGMIVLVLGVLWS